MTRKSYLFILANDYVFGVNLVVFFGIIKIRAKIVFIFLGLLQRKKKMIFKLSAPDPGLFETLDETYQCFGTREETISMPALA